MRTSKHRRRTTLSWLFVAGLFVLCGVLGLLQSRWIGEVSVAARDRLRGSLQASLYRLSLDFNTEIATACRALLPAVSGTGSPAVFTVPWYSEAIPVHTAKQAAAMRMKAARMKNG